MFICGLKCNEKLKRGISYNLWSAGEIKLENSTKLLSYPERVFPLLPFSSREWRFFLCGGWENSEHKAAEHLEGGRKTTADLSGATPLISVFLFR